MKARITFFILTLWTLHVCAFQDFYVFKNQTHKERFELLTSELRCLVCQNQNLSESNAPLATDLRNQIYEQISEGREDDEIIHYLVERYGNFILYRPPLNPFTIGLWFGPILLLLVSLFYLIYYIRRKKRA
jgi:cytochrome c-type biogenesis protein CcmH